jgi:hypothetical protein
MAKIDPAILAHSEWLGFVQPTGLVVSAPALVRAGAILDRRDAEGQRLLRECTEERVFNPSEGPVAWVPDFPTFARKVLGWNFSPNGYAGTEENPIPPELEVPLPEYGETLRPDYAVHEFNPHNGALPWQLLVRVIEPVCDFDRSERGPGGMEASAHGRMERLLRQTGVSAGLLVNGRALRLISAPRGESSGWLDFKVADMVQTAGRPISTALRLLLSQTRLLSLPREKRLAALLDDSRKYQNEVSERLAEQVLHALYELLRGFQAAHDASKGNLLREPLAEHPDVVYRALLTVILRLVFLLYAEERDMLPEGETFLRHYSLAGLYERLREDAALNPDTMDQRYGAWAQLLVLFRLIHDGADSGLLNLPKRHGILFDPDRFPFLEGRIGGAARQVRERLELPLVPDGTIYRALEKLIVLEGERISYRALDVEQIGSVYETMMGFRLETATGRSIAIKAAKRHGAPTTIDLETLLGTNPTKRKKWIQDRTDRKITDRVNREVKDAETIEDIHAALEPVLDKDATPDLVPKGAMVLQPSEERRRSGSHYTPRTLTEPIVRTTLEPILKRLRKEDGRPPRPEQILDLKVCDPAMGSGAFLVEACRQLGDELIESWHAHYVAPQIPPDEDEVIYARRLVAQRCLYGVDRNPVAVDLAKVSLWLVTLAREHAFTFLNHALRHGDSLVGLKRQQIEALNWDTSSSPIMTGLGVQEALRKVSDLRRRIRDAGDEVSDIELRALWDQVQFELKKVRLFGDLIVAAFFNGSNRREREATRSEYANSIISGEAERHSAWIEELRQAEAPLVPFHWEIEFSEVFERENPGFDAFVGNPPFANKNTVIQSNPTNYISYLKYTHPDSHGNADLVAHFFRRTFNYLRHSGSLGLIATNTIAQGDTRTSGLRWICNHGGEIYSARRRVKWPGRAAVTVSIIHVIKGEYSAPFLLGGVEVPKITAFLVSAGGNENPVMLRENTGQSFAGFYTAGKGFTFDDTETDANSVSLMSELINKNPENNRVIHPYMGGLEINNHPRHSPHRYIIDFEMMSAEEASVWKEIFDIVFEKVRPYRLGLNRKALRERWWQFAEVRPGLRAATATVNRVLATSCVSKHRAFAFVPSNVRLSHNVAVVTIETFSAFAMLQSSAHELWSSFFSSSLEDRLGYRSSDCFDTFPFPENWQNHPVLEESGKVYYEFRADLMVKNDEGLTKTYNRFHDPEERDPEIIKLRELHSEMDRVVLDSYGWNDIPTDCEFLLDFEIDEEEWGNRKKPLRYRWPDDVRDKVLARLLELNAKRAKEEARAGLVNSNKSSGKRSKKKHKSSLTGDLFS